ncbi:MAG: hypothetical protein PUB10_00855 [Clostridiales bacterium]|nr:hypothetical protein [Clostridiales bacterium]
MSYKTNRPKGTNNANTFSKEEFFESDVIKKMAPAKRAILEQLINSSTGSLLDAFPLLLAAQSSLHSQGLSFTPEETAEITSFLTSRMSPDERKKMEILKRFGS